MPAKKKEQLILRNLQTLPLSLRLGSRRDPFFLELKRRGEPGDLAAIPIALADHPDVLRLTGYYFEEITPEEAKTLRYEAPVKRRRSDRSRNRDQQFRRDFKVADIEEVEADSDHLNVDHEYHRPEVPHRFGQPDIYEESQLGPRIVRRPGSDNTWVNSDG